MIRTIFRGVLLLVRCMLGIVKFLLLFVGTFVKLVLLILSGGRCQR